MAAASTLSPLRERVEAKSRCIQPPSDNPYKSIPCDGATKLIVNQLLKVIHIADQPEDGL
ncbi:MAG: hypothetical protein HY287_06925 [Planctomycetes bacterium]|nr:hypothetical protein [Planctomycetota bacterium]